MTDLEEAISHLTAWIRDFGHEKQPAFIKDLTTVINAAEIVAHAINNFPSHQANQISSALRAGQSQASSLRSDAEGVR